MVLFFISLADNYAVFIHILSYLYIIVVNNSCFRSFFNKKSLPEMFQQANY